MEPFADVKARREGPLPMHIDADASGQGVTP